MIAWFYSIIILQLGFVISIVIYLSNIHVSSEDDDPDPINEDQKENT